MVGILPQFTHSSQIGFSPLNFLAAPANHCEVFCSINIQDDSSTVTSFWRKCRDLIVNVWVLKISHTRIHMLGACVLQMLWLIPVAHISHAPHNLGLCSSSPGCFVASASIWVAVWHPHTPQCKRGVGEGCYVGKNGLNSLGVDTIIEIEHTKVGQIYLQILRRFNKKQSEGIFLVKKHEFKRKNIF